MYRAVGAAFAASLAAGVFVAVFRQFFDTSRSIATFQDATDMMLPLFHHASACFARGEYPYWIDSVMGGLPLYDSPMFSAEYPFYLLRLPLFSDPVGAMVTVHWLSVLHLVILVVNSYVLMRCLRLAWLPAAFAAGLFASCPNNIDYAEWVNIIAPYSWFPLVVAGLLKALDARSGGAGVVLGGVALGLLCLAAPAHAMLHVGIVAVILFGHAAARRLQGGDARGLVAMSARVGALFGLGFALGAPAILPAVLSSGETIRFNGDFPPIIGGARIPVWQALHGQLAPHELAGALLPVEITHLTGRPFIGLGGAFFALVGLARWRQGRHVVPLALIAVYALVSSTGAHTALAWVNQALPLLGRFRQPPRHLFLFVFAASALAGYGFQYVLAAPRLRERRTLVLAAAFALLALLAFSAPLPWMDPELARFTVTGGLVGILVVLVARKRGRWAATAGALLIVGANATFPTRVPTLEDGDLFAPTHQRIHAVLQQLTQLPAAATQRFVFLDGDATQWWSMSGIYYGVRTFQVYMNPLPYRQWDELFQRFHLRHYYPLLGARYLLCRECDTPLARDYRPLRSIDGYTLLEADSAQPLYSVAGRVDGTYRDADEFYNAVDEGRDLRGAVLVDAGAPDAAEIAQWLVAGTQPATTITETLRSPNRRGIDVVSDRRALVVLNEYARSEWRALRNGAPVPTHRVNLNQLGVLVEPGRSQIDFEYRPALFIGLLWLERATALGLGLFLASRAWSARRATVTPPPPA